MSGEPVRYGAYELWYARKAAEHTYVRRDGSNVAFITKDEDRYTVRGFFGQVYGTGKTKAAAFRNAVDSGRRMGGVPAEAAQ